MQALHCAAELYKTQETMEQSLSFSLIRDGENAHMTYLNATTSVVHISCGIVASLQPWNQLIAECGVSD